MVAVINSAKAIRGAFLYNENKVKEGVAVCLAAENYPLDLDKMTEQMRLNMLLRYSERHPTVERPSIHISLNFAPEEKYSEEFLKQLAREYMQGIGFGDQPYLIYQHFDSGHPHLHLVTTKVRHDGSLIPTNNLGRGLSTKVRKELEIKHGLVKAEDHTKALFQPKAVNASVVKYGQVSTKRAISSVLSSVLSSYKYTSLAELNAVLKLYNVEAQRGDPDSRMYKRQGLAYRVLDADGRPIGTPIVSSRFHQKALLKDIENRFLKNDVERQKHKTSLKVSIDYALRSNPESMDALQKLLSAKGVDLIARKNETGMLYGITFVDHRSKCVFNGSQLGKQYSAKYLQEKIGGAQIRPANKPDQSPHQRHNPDKKVPSERISSPLQSDQQTAKESAAALLIEQLMQAEYGSNYLPYELRNNPRKKKKRKNKHL